MTWRFCSLIFVSNKIFLWLCFRKLTLAIRKRLRISVLHFPSSVSNTTELNLFRSLYLISTILEGYVSHHTLYLLIIHIESLFSWFHLVPSAGLQISTEWSIHIKILADGNFSSSLRIFSYGLNKSVEKRHPCCDPAIVSSTEMH